MKDSIKDKLNKLYALAMHEATPKNEKDSAKNFMHVLMAKHGIKDYSEFLTSGSDVGSSNDTWLRYITLKPINPFIRNIAMIIGDYAEDTILFNGSNNILCVKELTHDYLDKILNRYNYHIDQRGNLVKSNKNNKDYSHGFVYGVFSYFSIKKSEEKAQNTEYNSESIAVISKALASLKDNNDVTPIDAKETDMGKIEDQRLFLLGLRHGKEFAVNYIDK